MSSELWWFAGLFGCTVVVAALVNTLAPVQRPRLRRAVVMLAMALLAYGLEHLAREAEVVAWPSRLAIAVEITRWFVLVHLGALLVFLVLLPRMRLALPVIAGELVAGVGYVVAIFGVLAQHELDLTSVLATGAVVSAVLAISMQQTLGNVIGGVAVQLDGSVHEGDWIQFENGKQGKICAIRWRHSIVETRDYQTIVVPNAWLLGNHVMILGQRSGKHVPQRSWAYFNVDYRFAPSKVCRAVDDGLRGSPIPNVAEDPPPTCLCLDFGKDHHDSYTTYGVQYWQHDMARNDSTGSRVRIRIFAALQRSQIPLAVPAIKQLTEMHGAEHDADHARREADAHLAAIRTVGLFRVLDEGELRTLADGLIYAPFVEGETITRQGAVAHYLYILTTGKVEIRTKVDPDGGGPAPLLTRAVATLEAPDFFGEMGLVTGEPRTADVVALTDVECYRLERATFQRVLLGRPEIAVELSDKLAARRVALGIIREGLDEAARGARMDAERARILTGIRGFFGL